MMLKVICDDKSRVTCVERHADVQLLLVEAGSSLEREAAMSIAEARALASSIYRVCARVERRLSEDTLDGSSPQDAALSRAREV